MNLAVPLAALPLGACVQAQADCSRPLEVPVAPSGLHMPLLLGRPNLVP